MELPKRYEPEKVEDRIYDYWEENGYFRAEVNEDKEPFSVVIPPPNVTSELHVGHALQFTLHDIVIRYQRMKGKEACWFPGMDHAGIATQNVVEKHLAEENKTRHDLGREKFVERVWEWKDEYGGKIKDQLKALGSSPDWSRERFTLDEGLSRAVREAFVQLYEEDYIYRDKYIINWCPRCSTALSDIEVEHEEEEGKLYWINYELKNSDEAVTIATTRPETMLGDTALAIHPKDGRSEKLAGKKAVLPLVGREIPVVEDEVVDPEFGSGIVKVTPAHDPTDFEIGETYGLETISVIDDDANISFEGKYKGMDRYEAREEIVRDLDETGLLEEIEDYEHSVGHCQRCETVVEPSVSEQWFVEMEDLAEPAIEAVRKDEVELIPDRWKKVYFEWMENIQDWCISRQLWWGHRIPAWHCEDCGEIVVSREEPHTCTSCGSSELTQETDVLDTWFSSALWPFSVMGWPEETEELDYFFPTNLLITGFDIIFFWVARMIMTSLHFMDEVPFDQVLLTPLVLDENGEKMSSSKGNILDPLELKEEYGADSVRFAMASSTTKGRGMKLSEGEIEDKRNFLNKLWNAARFALPHFESGDSLPSEKELELEDRWILSRYTDTVTQVEKDLEDYSFKSATKKLYSFVWNDFCDWYLELIKPRLYSEEGDEGVKRVLGYTLKGTLTILHPFIPFITEEIWDKLSETSEPIMIQDLPDPESGTRNREAEEKLSALQEMIKAIRNVRGEMNIPTGKGIKVLIDTENGDLGRLAEEKLTYFQELANVDELITGTDLGRPENSARRVLEDSEVLVPLEGLIDIEKERERIKNELTEVENDLDSTLRKLNNEDFLKKAPDEVVSKEKKKKEEFLARKDRLETNLVALEDN
ncbi:MAG: valine--tRNA ligase [Candidatus Bipolaricaulota bacterium]|nr:valine--tRNA ligase [Candidatus Bipolaricaulota bacterium]